MVSADIQKEKEKMRKGNRIEGEMGMAEQKKKKKKKKQKERV